MAELALLDTDASEKAPPAIDETAASENVSPTTDNRWAGTIEEPEEPAAAAANASPVPDNRDGLPPDGAEHPVSVGRPIALPAAVRALQFRDRAHRRAKWAQFL